MNADNRSTLPVIFIVFVGQNPQIPFVTLFMDFPVVFYLLWLWIFFIFNFFENKPKYIYILRNRTLKSYQLFRSNLAYLAHSYQLKCTFLLSKV